jgi:predicted TIM-barrel fold metal-dependent hydrolase
MADEPLIDTHVHFWDHAVSTLRWPWLEPGFVAPPRNGSAGARLADVDAPRYTAPEFRAETAGANVAGLIHVDATGAVDDPALETEWLEALATSEGLPTAIVGGCRLTAPSAPAVLRRHARHRRFRGVRDMRWDPDESLGDLSAAMDVLADLDVTLELRAPHERSAALVALARHWPAVQLALSHGCLPRRRDAANLAAWRSAFQDLALLPNVVCKISAVAGVADPNWTIGSIRPWVLTAVEVFGAHRSMLGTNWPVDRLFGTYERLVDAYREILTDLDPAERAAIFHGTATRVYRLEPSLLPPA